MLPKVGDRIICSETGKAFIVESNGFTYNYARDSEGKFYSDEGVNIRETNELLDRTKPFFCYLSRDGKTVTGWKGNVLGNVQRLTVGGGFGNCIHHIRVTDVHGGEWYGRGPGLGMYTRLRACKS